VEKALRKIQTELRKSKTSSSDSTLQNLQELLDQTNGNEDVLSLLPIKGATGARTSPAHPVSEEIAPNPRVLATSPPFVGSPPHVLARIAQSPGEQSSPHESNGSISNPLGLVADACVEVEAEALDQQSNGPLSLLHPASASLDILPVENGPANCARSLLRRPGYVSLGLKLDKKTLEQGLSALLTKNVRMSRYSDYFKPLDTNKGRDTGPELDPVDLGLVSMEEANYLFPL
jgi:hypothetical protein